MVRISWVGCEHPEGNTTFWANTIDRHPPTSEQETLLRHDVTLTDEKHQDVCILMHACHCDDKSASDSRLMSLRHIARGHLP